MAVLLLGLTLAFSTPVYAEGEGAEEVRELYDLMSEYVLDENCGGPTAGVNVKNNGVTYESKLLAKDMTAPNDQDFATNYCTMKDKNFAELNSSDLESYFHFLVNIFNTLDTYDWLYTEIEQILYVGLEDNWHQYKDVYYENSIQEY